MKILVYDCEIIKAILPDYKNEAKLEDIEYCEGWGDFENMGISVIGTYNNWTKESIAFVDPDFYDIASDTGLLDDLNHLNIKHFRRFQDLLDETDIIVGFNNQHFDDNLIKANRFTIPDKVVNYDILVEMWKAVGLKPPFIYPTHAGYSLKQSCEVNDLAPKTGNGANAAILWQRGKYKEVIEYCLNDIKITTDLLRKITSSNGWINNPKTKIKLRTITELNKCIQK